MGIVCDHVQRTVRQQSYKCEEKFLPSLIPKKELFEDQIFFKIRALKSYLSLNCKRIHVDKLQNYN